MGKLMLLSLVVATVSACTTATEMRTASGREVIVRCGVAMMSPCVDRAEKECLGPYEVLSVSGGQTSNNMHVRCQS